MFRLLKWFWRWFSEPRFTYEWFAGLLVVLTVEVGVMWVVMKFINRHWPLPPE
jgi:flagellar biogenesis protein FliO